MRFLFYLEEKINVGSISGNSVETFCVESLLFDEGDRLLQEDRNRIVDRSPEVVESGLHLNKIGLQLSIGIRSFFVYYVKRFIWKFINF